METTKILQVKRFGGDKDFNRCNRWIIENSKLIDVSDVQIRTENSGAEFVLCFYGIKKEDVERLG